jgi:hypothetical protein
MEGDMGIFGYGEGRNSKREVSYERISKETRI